MKKASWVLYLFEDNDKRELFKIMEFRTIREIGLCLDIEPQVISNWFHGLINARGLLKNCALYQSVVL